MLLIVAGWAGEGAQSGCAIVLCVVGFCASGYVGYDVEYYAASTLE